MKIGYTLNPIDINDIVKVTSADRFPEVALDHKTLQWMLKHVGVFGILIARSDEGELIGFAILNCSYSYSGRVDIAHFYITEKYRRWPTICAKELYQAIEKQLVKCKVHRVQAHTNSKMIGRILKNRGFKEEARLQSWGKGQDFTQYYKLLGR